MNIARASALLRRRALLACWAGTALPQARAAAPWNARWPRIPDVSLLNHRGQSVALRPLLAAGPVVVNFIYTGCSSFCPPQTAIFKQLQTLLADEPALRATLVSLSIDPLGDGPIELTRYARRFDARLGAQERWHMLTGGPAGVQAVAEVQRAFGAHAASLEQHPAQLWLGDAAKARALRSLGVARASDLLAWLREAAA
ncbi:MAG: SCO family protein [Proteobacteria bacterium]|nr:SCO family protein [Pseudomonadota bacterium]